MVVRNFYSQAAREKIIQEIENSMKSNSNISNWKVTQSNGELKNSDVNTIGIPLNVAKGSGRVNEYYSGALNSTRRFRLGETLSPIDKVRLELDEVHPYGCILGRDEATRNPHAAGLIRIMKRSSNRGLVHLDDLSECLPHTGVFSANVYLQTSLAGGEIEIWPVSLNSKDLLMDYALELGLLTSSSAEIENQRLLREFVLPGAPIQITPNPGDLLLLCVQRPHSVRGPIHGSRARLSAQCFVLHKGG